MASAHTLPGLDEGTFQQMLEAAYVLQERRKQQPPPPRKLELGDTLAEIAATMSPDRRHVAYILTLPQHGGQVFLDHLQGGPALRRKKHEVGFAPAVTIVFEG